MYMFAVQTSLKYANPRHEVVELGLLKLQSETKLQTTFGLDHFLALVGPTSLVKGPSLGLITQLQL